MKEWEMKRIGWEICIIAIFELPRPGYYKALCTGVLQEIFLNS